MKKLCKQILESNGFITNKIIHLNSGAASIIYLAKTNKGWAVIVIKLRQGDSFDNAFSILKKIEQYKISPKAYFHGILEGKPYLIEQYIPGKRLSWTKITNKEIIMMAQFFNKLHFIKIDSGLSHKVKGYSPLDKLDYPKHFMHLDSNFANLVSIAEKKLKNQLKNLKISKTLVLRHADPNPHNFIISKNKIIAVDWDWAKIGHFATDIADFFIKANITEKQKNLFYSKYNFKNIKKIVDAYIITGILGLITWHLQTIDLIKQKKLHKKIYKNIFSEKNKVKRRMKQLEEILKNDIHVEIVKNKKLSKIQKETINNARVSHWGEKNRKELKKDYEPDTEWFFVKIGDKIVSFGGLRPIKIKYTGKTYNIKGICSTISLEKSKGYGKIMVAFMIDYSHRTGKTLLGFTTQTEFFKKAGLGTKKDFIKRFVYRNPKTGEEIIDNDGDGIYYEGKDGFIKKVLSTKSPVYINVEHW